MIIFSKEATTLKNKKIIRKQKALQETNRIFQEKVEPARKQIKLSERNEINGSRRSQHRAL